MPHLVNQSTKLQFKSTVKRDNPNKEYFDITLKFTLVAEYIECKNITVTINSIWRFLFVH